LGLGVICGRFASPFLSRVFFLGILKSFHGGFHVFSQVSQVSMRARLLASGGEGGNGRARIDDYLRLRQQLHHGGPDRSFARRLCCG
jgi:hypothetical protein